MTRSRFTIPAVSACLLLACAGSGAIQAEELTPHERVVRLEMTILQVILEDFAGTHEVFPTRNDAAYLVETVKELRELLPAGRIPRNDPWGRPYLYWSDGATFMLISYGPDREPDTIYDFRYREGIDMDAPGDDLIYEWKREFIKGF